MGLEQGDAPGSRRMDGSRHPSGRPRGLRDLNPFLQDNPFRSARTAVFPPVDPVFVQSPGMVAAKGLPDALLELRASRPGGICTRTPRIIDNLRLPARVWAMRSWCEERCSVLYPLSYRSHDPAGFEPATAALSR